ncbi:MAG: hypothetical protein LBQ12_02565 [Deltaproteobacteria bacterium]|nr:hypothetical protein [Deltaproteobacteria bacterium]
MSGEIAGKGAASRYEGLEGRRRRRKKKKKKRRRRRAESLGGKRPEAWLAGQPGG